MKEEEERKREAEEKADEEDKKKRDGGSPLGKALSGSGDKSRDASAPGQDEKPDGKES